MTCHTFSEIASTFSNGTTVFMDNIVKMQDGSIFEKDGSIVASDGTIKRKAFTEIYLINQDDYRGYGYPPGIWVEDNVVIIIYNWKCTNHPVYYGGEVQGIHEFLLEYKDVLLEPDDGDSRYFIIENDPPPLMKIILL
jgi:hypothetical protein